MKNGIWWLLGAIGLVAVASSGKSNNKSEGLEGLNTAKTKAGKVRQRKAVFAKLDESGKTYPKNKKGKRMKSKKSKTLSGSENAFPKSIKVKKSNYGIFKFASGYFGICEKGTYGGNCVHGGDSANEDDYNKEYMESVLKEWDGTLYYHGEKYGYKISE